MRKYHLTSLAFYLELTSVNYCFHILKSLSTGFVSGDRGGIDILIPGKDLENHADKVLLCVFALSQIHTNSLGSIPCSFLNFFGIMFFACSKNQIHACYVIDLEETATNSTS